MELPGVPAHLRGLVVQQDYGQYSEVDQAVWRFVVMQAYRRLCHTAHAAYAQGFAAAGIEVERIPRIEQMSERLASFGWRAVCVDGFIPPRAFQAFQARGVLPIAADIRRVEHLAYTPAPDIVHEAAGHAPLLADPAYARFVRRIGRVGEHAFANRGDAELYQAIYTLSEIKERQDSTPEQIARAEDAVLRAQRAIVVPSEAGQLARLYWWTVEYGLIGTPDDYRLYGAGLLSSLGEAHFCHDPNVRKLPLSAACIDVDYDITRAQPQLFVAESFEQLEDVLEQVDRGLSHARGGEHALAAALASEELATLELDSGAELSGVLTAVHSDGGEPLWLELSGRCALGHGGQLLRGLPQSEGLLQPLGVRDDGVPLDTLDPFALARSLDAHGQLRLELHNGLSIEGTLIRPVVAAQGRVIALLLERARIARGGQQLARYEHPHVLALGRKVVTAVPGALDGYHPETEFSNVRVPRPSDPSAAQRQLRALYERALEAWRSQTGAEVVTRFEQIADKLDAEFADDWLLRFNLLESLVKLGEGDELAGRLERELERLEIRFAHREPIATGLRYVRAIGGDSGTGSLPGRGAAQGRSDPADGWAPSGSADGAGRARALPGKGESQ
jgi:phenylalanine-4-hydroxylase